MGMEEVEVTIGPDGQVTINVHGFEATACLTANAELEHALATSCGAR
jgi:DUF2997 family protein